MASRILWRGLVIAAAAIVPALLAFYLLRGVWATFALAIVLTYLLAPAVDYLQRQGMRRATAILLLYLLISLGTAVAVVYLLPGFLDEVNRLGAQLPSYSRRARALLEGVRQDAASATLPAGVRNALLERIDGTGAWISARLAALTDGVMQAVMGAAPLLLAPVIAFYLLNDLDRFRAAAAALLTGRRQRWLELLRAIDRVVAGFIRGQLLVAGCVGLMVTLACALLGLRFPVLLGLFAGLADLVPYFGPAIGAVPVLAMALLQSPATVIQVVLALLLIQWIENTILAPRVLGQTVGLHPLAVIAALLVAGRHFGLPGLLLAVPVTGLLWTLVTFFWPDLALQPGRGRREPGPGQAGGQGGRSDGAVPRTGPRAAAGAGAGRGAGTGAGARRGAGAGAGARQGAGTAGQVDGPRRKWENATDRDPRR
ncbi:MAG TPA: AI-2E family transporter [Thermaerobacter sp.]